MTNEKRLQALAELQEDGERMEKFDLEKAADELSQELWEQEYRKSFDEVFDSQKGHVIAYKAGFNKGAELERERVLDLVIELAKEASESTQPNDEDWPMVMIADLKAIISKLRGEK